MTDNQKSLIGEENGTPLLDATAEQEEETQVKWYTKPFVKLVLVLGVAVPVFGAFIFGIMVAVQGRTQPTCGSLEADQALRLQMVDILSAIEKEETEKGITINKFTVTGDIRTTCLPAGLFNEILQDMNRFETISIQGLRLDTISPDTFKLERNNIVTRLEIIGSRLAELPAGLLSSFRSLEELSLKENRITDFPPDFFQDITTLKTLELNDNPTMTAIPSALSSLPEAMENVDFSGCLTLAEFSDDVFVNSPNVEVNIEGTLLEATVEVSTFVADSGLSDESKVIIPVSVPCDIALDDTTRTTIANFVSSQGATETISFSGLDPSINCLPPRMFADVDPSFFDTVETLDFSGTSFTEIKFDAFFEFPAEKIKTVSFSENVALTSFPQFVFVPLINADKFDFSGTSVTFNAQDSPKLPATLEELDMSRTRVTRVESPFEGVDSVSVINLSDNEGLSSFKENLFFGVSVGKIDLSNSIFSNLLDARGVAQRLALDTENTEIILSP